MRTRYWPEIVAAATEFDLDPILVEAIVVQESAGNTDAFRFEPNYFNRYLKPINKYPGQNPRRVSSSYGLMQIMYDVAFDLGHKDAPELLFYPAMGLHYGCKRLRKLLDWAAGYPKAGADQQRLAALASYNGGMGGNRPDQPVLRNGTYARSVMANYAILTKEHALSA